MPDIDPYAAFRSGPSDNLLTVLRLLAEQFQDIEQQIEDATKDLETKQSLLKDLVEKTIPNAADGIHGKLDLKDGRYLELGEKIRASIAGEKKMPALEWLDANGYGNLIKRTVVVQFNKDQTELFKKFMKKIEELEAEEFVRLPVERSFDVHWATFESWVREKLKAGVDLPREKFGIYEQKITKISGEKSE